MEFRILGPLEVLDEGRPVALGGSRRRALLALLLLHAGEILPAERIVDALWGEARAADRGADAPRAGLPPAQGARGGRVRAGHPRPRLRAHARARAARRPPVRGVCSSRAGRARRRPSGRRRRRAGARPRAVARRGARRSRVRAVRPGRDRASSRSSGSRRTSSSSTRELALGRHAEVVGPLQTLIGEHPYRERLRGQLMLALYRCDRQADALQAYQEARRALVEELGIEPGEHRRRARAAGPRARAVARRAGSAAPVAPAAPPLRRRRPPPRPARRTAAW